MSKNSIYIDAVTHERWSASVGVGCRFLPIDGQHIGCMAMDNAAGMNGRRTNIALCCYTVCLLLITLAILLLLLLLLIIINIAASSNTSQADQSVAPFIPVLS